MRRASWDKHVDVCSALHAKVLRDTGDGFQGYWNARADVLAHVDQVAEDLGLDLDQCAPEVAIALIATVAL